MKKRREKGEKKVELLKKKAERKEGAKEKSGIGFFLSIKKNVKKKQARQRKEECNEN